MLVELEIANYLVSCSAGVAGSAACERAVALSCCRSCMMFSCCRAVHDGCGIGVCVVLNMPTDSRTGTPRGPASEEGCVCAGWYLSREP